MSLAIYTSAAWTNSGGLKVADDATIEVRRESDGALATIYSDRAGTLAITNPSAFGDASGRFQFFAAGGAYRVKVTQDGEEHELRWQAIGTAGEFDASAVSQAVDSVENLRTSTFPASLERLWLSGYYGVGTAGGGPLYRDSADTTTADNGGTVFVDGSGVRWKRPYCETRTASEFGVTPGDDVRSELQNALDHFDEYEVFVFDQPEVYGLIVAQGSSPFVSVDGIRDTTIKISEGATLLVETDVTNGSAAGLRLFNPQNVHLVGPGRVLGRVTGEPTSRSNFQPVHFYAAPLSTTPIRNCSVKNITGKTEPFGIVNGNVAPYTFYFQDLRDDKTARSRNVAYENVTIEEGSFGRCLQARNIDDTSAVNNVLLGIGGDPKGPFVPTRGIRFLGDSDGVTIANNIIRTASVAGQVECIEVGETRSDGSAQRSVKVHDNTLMINAPTDSAHLCCVLRAMENYSIQGNVMSSISGLGEEIGLRFRRASETLTAGMPLSRGYISGNRINCQVDIDFELDITNFDDNVMGHNYFGDSGGFLSGVVLREPRNPFRVNWQHAPSPWFRDNYRRSTVTTTAQTISRTQRMASIVVYGEQDGAGTTSFIDTVLWTAFGNALVTNTSERGAPAARTYNVNSNSLELSMASDTYNVGVQEVTFRGDA